MKIPKVEKGIPIPSRRRDRSVTKRIKLKTGDSVLVEGARGASDSDVSAWSQLFRRMGYTITSRSVENGVRIWRIG
jgi:hypothetical protein